MSAKIHFYLRTDRPAKDGSAQIILLFTIDRTHRLKISTGKFIPLKKEYRKLSLSQVIDLHPTQHDDLYCWDTSQERAIKGAPNWEMVNNYLDSEKDRANKILLKYELMNKPVTLDLFKNAMTKPSGNNNFELYFTDQLEKRKHLIANDTYRGYKATISKIVKYKPNLSLSDIDYKFLSQFENHMMKPIIEKGLGNIPSTVSKTMKMVRALILIAIKNEDYLKEAYPFKDYRIKHIDPVLTSRDYLEPEDLLKIEKLLFPGNLEKLSIGEVKAVKRFLFACYTGLRFSDVNALHRKQHIFGKYVLNPNTNEMVFRFYIELRMSKTSQPIFIPLIDKALDLINETEGDYIFEKISNQKINKHLKEINTKAGLNKKLSFHVARHSFATICFLYGIPEKVGQKLLGHKNRKFTEVYTHLSQNKLFYEMDKLNRGLSPYEILVDENENNTTDVKALLPMLQNLNREKLDQIKGLLKLLGS